jgi:hypothetical protein
MSKREKGRMWDGVSRPTTDLYKQNFDRIFKNGTTKKVDRATDEVRLRAGHKRGQKNSN